jgi:uncharacterized membrane protein
VFALEQLLTLLFVSMLPVVELRGGIPIGVAMGLDFWTVFVVCVIGNLLPVPILIPFAGRVLRWCATWPKVGFIFERIIDIGYNKIGKINPHYLFWGLFVFVAVPLPGTGAWGGSLVATLMGLRLRSSFPAIALGVVAGGIVIGLLSYGVAGLFGALVM